VVDNNDGGNNGMYVEIVDFMETRLTRIVLQGLTSDLHVVTVLNELWSVISNLLF